MSALSAALQGGRRLATRAAYEAKTIAAAYPSLAVPAARWRGHGEVVAPDTHILIEGYPRSANQFAVAAFRLAQGRPVSVAHHTHAPGHVLAALRLGVPALVLIREPEESILEFLIVRPHLTIRQVLRGWVRFYSTLAPHRSRFVTGAFRDVIGDYGAVIRHVNRRFSTRFAEFDHTEENVRECFRQMDAYWHERVGPAGSIEAYVGRPSDERERRKDAMRHAYRQTPAALRRRAEALYRTYTGEHVGEREAE
ncbi:MAG: hypothetical protein AB1551_04435 [Actinomycetota bacterium]